MEKETTNYYQKAAGILRQILRKPEAVPTPGEKPKPAEPVAPATPAVPAQPAEPAK